ncbi:sushi domain-containing protein 2 [Limosa lapponica baueri]|uniref:Sushi domain-containing protein 2 n=1 Tax=Limosa lapponica baueri TaxID=1758121 RepID=A0A2I0TFA9_LIMLA|nr:sushi domain-containing protein 2 [Limosa lapponica baueri]
MACFVCGEGARLADGERIDAVCSLLRQPNPDVQRAVLSWVISREGGTHEELEKALRLTLLESLRSVLQERRDKEFLRLYLEALLHLYREPSSWSQEASRKLHGSSAACLEKLLHMVEAECPGPDFLFQVLCAASLLLAHRCEEEDGTLVERWCRVLEECGRSASCEVLRLAAARALRQAGAIVVQRSLRPPCPALVPVALRFKQEVKTHGYVGQDGRAHCISPLLYETGFIPFDVSTDGGKTFPYSGTWLSGYLNLHPQYAAGQQCCYDRTGTQILTHDSTGGSTPDRGHDWGSPPFLKPPRIPGFSHWLYDVISFYYCCLWSDNCHVYMKKRSSSDCRTYRPPRAGTGAQVTGLAAVAMQENNSDVIEVRYSKDSNLQVLLNQRVVDFSEQSWLDLKGLFLHSTADQKITAMFSSGSGVEIRGIGGFLTVTVLLPEKFMNHTQGLFGVMNDNTEDDYTFRNKTTMPVHASPQQVFEFGANWAVENGTSLFTYDTESLLNDFVYQEKHNASFLPVFIPHEDPADPLVEKMVLLCDSDPFCRFDVLTTRSLEVGNSTKRSHQNHKLLVENLKPVISCGWLGHPANGTKNGTNYLLGSTISFACNQGYALSGAKERTCQVTGTWSGDTTTCTQTTDIKQVIFLACVFGVIGLAVLARLTFLCRKERREAHQKLLSEVRVASEQETMKFEKGF